MNPHINPKQEKFSRTLTRFSGAIFGAITLWNIIWVFNSPNTSSSFTFIISRIFFGALCLTGFGILLNIVNSWDFTHNKPMKLTRKIKPMVAVIVPTYGEPVEIVMKTIQSVVDQDWPKEKRIAIVSDDAQNPKLEKEIQTFAKNNRGSRIIYFNPPKKEGFKRYGEAKAGNLNAAFGFILKNFPYVQFIETRDADDLVGTKDFLLFTIGHLVRNPEISFVQTIKRCQTHPRDPFSNNETVFYEATMPARDSKNSAFPCGSGLVWRASELKRLKGFPVWNLVEDLQSGIEILKIKGKGSYLPIIGAIGQIAPEDIANFYKQRGTWALDSLRLFFWKNPFFNKGLNFWQKIQFFELEYSYLLSWPIAVFITTLVLNLFFNIYPVQDAPAVLQIRFLLFAAWMELFNYIKARGIPYKDQLRGKQIWLGLMPVFMLATIKAIQYGPYLKPSYKVTRKYHQIAWYWKETIIQKAVILSLSFGILWNIFFFPENFSTNIIAIAWSIFFIYIFQRTMRNSWHGLHLKKEIISKVQKLREKNSLKIAELPPRYVKA